MSTLQVNLPEVKRKPLLPGPNSWAQDAQNANVMKGSISGVATKGVATKGVATKGVATNRSKYEVSHLEGLSPSQVLIKSKRDPRNRLVL